MIEDYVSCLKAYKNNKWNHLLEYVDFDGPGTYEKAPMILIAIGGEKDNDKLQLANLSLIDWQAATRKKVNPQGKKREKDDPCPWYQPSTQNVHLRTFFGTVQRVFGWQFQQSDFNFSAGLNGFIKDLYACRERTYGKVSSNLKLFQKSLNKILTSTYSFFYKYGYAVKDSKCTMSHDDINKIDLSLLDEDNPEEHIIKMLFICGIFFGFRGEVEHTMLEVRRITSGVFPEGHKWAGIQWFGIDFIIDKSNHLSIHKPYVRSIEDTQMKVPVIGDDPKMSDPGGCIKRFLDKLAPGQLRLYCRVLSKKSRSKEGETRLFSPNQPMGKDSIKALFRKGAKIMGLKNPDEFCPHSLRHLFGNQMANDPSISLKECMLAMRHSSASASMNYQERNMKSEENRLACLGFEPPKATSHELTSTNVASYPTNHEESSDEDNELIDFEQQNFHKRDFKSEPNSYSQSYSTNYVLSQEPIFSQDVTKEDSGTYKRKLEDLPTTQAAIDLVKQDIKALESETEMIRPKQSNERRQIVYLGEQVRDLRQKLQSMAKELYIYKEKERRGELIVKSPDDEIQYSQPKRARFISPPLNPYSKLKHGL